ncbi:hypothetical protein IYO1511_c20070 [Lactiplantibacillus plantarum]|nr:hypothetical protein IYO1511_c20070 [Lactiplantibacillus plantarum]
MDDDKLLSGDKADDEEASLEKIAPSANVSPVYWSGPGQARIRSVY